MYSKLINIFVQPITVTMLSKAYAIFLLFEHLDCGFEYHPGMHVHI